MAELGAKTGGWKFKCKVPGDEGSAGTLLPGSEKMSSHYVLMWWGGARKVSGVPFTRALIPPQRPPPS